MTHAGWFHRSGHAYQNSTLQWVPADTPPAHRSPPDHPAASDAPAPPGFYPVDEVKGHCPTGLDDFLGVTSFTLLTRQLTHRVFGTGTPENGAVLFRQQDLGREGRIIRTWLITTTPTGIVANPDPAALEQHPRRPAGPTGAAG